MSDQSPTTLYLNPYTGRYELLLQPGKWVSLFAILIVGAMAFGVDKKTEPPPSSSCKSDWHLCTVNAVAGPFQDGQAAFDKGDYLTALKFWLPLANEGNAKAQLQLYSLYIFGDGIPKNDAEALKWLRKAAEHDEPSAQFLLGLNYRWGNGVPKDVAEGLAWTRKAWRTKATSMHSTNSVVSIATVPRCRRTMSRQGNGTRWPPIKVITPLKWGLSGCTNTDKAGRKITFKRLNGRPSLSQTHALQDPSLPAQPGWQDTRAGSYDRDAADQRRRSKPQGSKLRRQTFRPRIIS